MGQCRSARQTSRSAPPGEQASCSAVHCCNARAQKEGHVVNYGRRAVLRILQVAFLTALSAVRSQPVPYPPAHPVHPLQLLLLPSV